MIHFNLPRSPAEARAKNERYYFTGKKCIRGHISRRRTGNSRCVKCEQEKHLKTYKPRRLTPVDTKRVLDDLSELEVLIVQVLDRVAFEHPHIWGAKARQTQAVHKAKELIRKITEAGFSLEKPSMQDTAEQMVAGYGLI